MQSLPSSIESRMESYRRQLPLRMPLHPNRARVQELPTLDCGLLNIEKHWTIKKPYIRDIGVAVQRSVSAWSKPVQPQFQSLYHEFESMKDKGLVILPSKFTDSESSASVNTEGPGDRDFTSAMHHFMDSYMPTSNFNKGTPMNDWSKEAENLLKELTDCETRSNTESSIWKIGKVISSTPDTSLSIGGDDAWSTINVPKIDDTSQEDTFDIHRHIMDIKPSPYPGSSPTASGKVANSSDNDADDEGVQSSAESAVETIGTGRNLKFHPPTASTTFDSGYISSSTDSDGKRVGEKAWRRRLRSDSDELGSIGTAPSSPHPAQTWQDPRLQNPFRYAFRPPLTPFMGGLSTFPLPPSAQLFPPMHAAALPSMHPPAFLPGIPPPPHQNVSFMTTVPQSYSQPHFMRQRFDPASAQTVGGTYHKHKPWITDEILEMIAVRDRLYKRMKKHPATDIVDMYKKVRNMVVGMTRNAKRSYEKRMDERVMERQLKGTNQVVESINMAIASKPFASRHW